MPPLAELRARDEGVGHAVSLHSREGLALLFALAVVLGIAFLSYRDWIAFSRHADQLDMTQRIVSGIDGLLVSITNAETGQRGFLLTGEDRYLDPYLYARRNIPILLESLETAARNRPDQARRIRSLNPLVEDKLAELALTIELRRSTGLDAALAVVRTDRGRTLMAEIRAICGEIQNVTNARLTEYTRQERSSRDEGVLVSVLGGASLFLFLVFATVTIRRGAARRESLIGELQHSEQRLEIAAAEAEAANRAKSAFLSSMSHEIRTPMNAILGYAQLMLRDPDLGAGAKANLKIIGRSGEHLLALINDVLDMSKIEAGRIELHPTTFNLPQLLTDLEAMFRLRAEAKALQFEMLTDGESVPYVVADEGKVRQALINLLGNAIKFTERGRIELHVTLEQRSSILWLSALVQDTGSGISEKEQAKLFEPFSQTSPSLNTQEGTGLGLAISRECARLMGGDITVTSAAGVGSIFRFEIPIERGDAGVAVRRSAARSVIGIRTGTAGPKVLVVDDQIENRDWLMKLLTAIGFSVRGAENGEAAIRHWEEWKPDLILMDVHMPVMNGLEATRKIKADPRGQTTAIMVLTASAMDEDRRAVAESGADDFVGKPCREDELLEKIRVLVNVAYDYEETNGTPSSAATSAEKFAQLPLALVEALRNATLSGDMRRLNQLILEVHATKNAESAIALQALADKYDYDALTHLLEEACRR